MFLPILQSPSSETCLVVRSNRDPQQLAVCHLSGPTLRRKAFRRVCHLAIQGLISLGGSAGTTIGTAAMRSLPAGFPKMMVSTLALGDARPYVGTKDIAMLYPIVDISGLNRLSRRILGNAAAAIAGMVDQAAAEGRQDKPLIAATMFGVTTPCVTMARYILERHGFEVLVFHATGTGGEAMESLIADGYVAGVLDITTTELADELAGGVMSAGPHRLEAAAAKGVPQVVCPGAIDMVNFGPLDSVPEKYRERRLYVHNPNVTLMRTSPEECAALGRITAEKLNRARGPVAFLMPLRGVSATDAIGLPFWWPEAHASYLDALKANLVRRSGFSKSTPISTMRPLPEVRLIPCCN
ncbi:MAG: Tm-1-like ATP-binding domain-containing protein [Terriglobia bacterium]